MPEQRNALPVMGEAFLYLKMADKKNVRNAVELEKLKGKRNEELWWLQFSY